MSKDKVTQANRLEPCPFCGSETRLMEGRGDWDRLDARPRPNVWWAHCWSCGTRSGEHQTAAEAIAAWNTRTQSPAGESHDG